VAIRAEWGATADSTQPMPAPDRRTIAATIRKLLRERGAGKSICPSDVARALSPDGFRALMPAIRAEAARLARERELVVMQRGEVVNIATARGPIRLALAEAGGAAYADAYRGIDFRRHPELYRVGRGEQGVLIAEPYKSELLPLWRFRTKAIAEASAAALWKAFVRYRRAGDCVGMDMTRKFLQMGFTRARRYANHRSGRKYDDAGHVAPRVADPEKARAAAVFHRMWQKLEADASYRAARAHWSERASSSSR